MKNFLSTDEITKDELEKLLSLSEEIQNNPKKFQKALDSKILATLFWEPSTRTRLSFEAACLRLGAQVISVENARESSSAGIKGESLEDTIRVVSGYADAIIMRHRDGDAAHRAAACSCVPIINAGSGSAHHPSQSLLDIYTIKQHCGKIDGLKIAFIGDLKYGRTANSLAKLLSLYSDIQIYCMASEGFGFEQGVCNFISCQSFDDIPKDVDVLYQTRIQRERFGEAAVAPLQNATKTITKEIISKFSPRTIIMHPLPRVDEISTDVDNDPRAVYFKQAHNGISTRMAILLTLLM